MYYTLYLYIIQGGGGVVILPLETLKNTKMGAVPFLCLFPAGLYPLTNPTALIPMLIIRQQD